MSDKSAAIVRQNDARVLRAFGEEMTVLLDGDHTGGKLAMWTAITKPGAGRRRTIIRTRMKHFMSWNDALRFSWTVNGKKSVVHEYSCYSIIWDSLGEQRESLSARAVGR